MPEITGYIWTRESNVYDKEKYSLKSQLDALREAAKADGIEVTPDREFAVQFSGRDLWAIPELTALRETVARTDGPKRIYCYSQDRLVRGEEGPEIFWLLFEFRRSGAEVVILKNPVDLKNIAGQILTLVAGHEAAGEIGKIKDRTMRGKKQRVLEGKLWGGGRDKYGYRRDHEQGRATIEETEAEIIRRIFRESIDGKGLMAIARDLNGDNIPTSFTARGELKSRWYPGTVRVLLRDPAYKGEVWAFRYSADGDRHRMPDGLFPPIVSAEIWAEAQARLDANRGAKARNERQPALLRGLIFCSECGRPLYAHRHAEPRKDGSKRHRLYYRCASDFLTAHESESIRCGAKSTRADTIEAGVWAEILRLITTPEKILAALHLTRTSGAAGQLQARLESANKRVKQIEAEQGRLAHRLRQADGRIAELLEAEILETETERDRLRTEAAQIEQEIAAQHELEVRVEQVNAICARMSEETRGEVPFAAKRKYLEDLGIRVCANGGKWDLQTDRFLSSSNAVLRTTYSVLARSGD